MLDLRTELFDNFINKDTEFYDRNKTGELISRISSDTSKVEGACSDNISSIFNINNT